MLATADLPCMLPFRRSHLQIPPLIPRPSHVVVTPLGLHSRCEAACSCAAIPSHAGSSRPVRLCGAVVAAAVAALGGAPRHRLALADTTGSQGDGSIEQAAGLSEADKRLVAELFQQALDAPTVEEEESFWTKILDKYSQVPEVGARVFCNRGNSRARQGKFDSALADYGRSIALAPDQADGYLNRGATYEAVGRLEDALNDYDTVLSIDISDPAAWNNRGNALLGLGRYEEASKALKTALSYVGSQQQPIAAVNLNLAEYELGNDKAVLKDLRQLLTRFADAFPDARAFYALLLWESGDRVQGEAEWDRAIAVDPRYKSMEWVRDFRRWPPRLRGVLSRFSETTNVKVK